MQQLREVREQHATQGGDPYRDTPAGFAELIRNDVVKYGKVIRDIGLKVD